MHIIYAWNNYFGAKENPKYFEIYLKTQNIIILDQTF